MGHVRLGKLPRTKKWREVVGLIAAGADVAQVANVTLIAAEDAFEYVNVNEDEEFNIFSKKEFPGIGEFLGSMDIALEPIDKLKELLNKPKYKKDILAKNNVTNNKEAATNISNLESKFSCRKCNSTNIKILYRNSYYFKCSACGGNTPIKLTCNSCGSFAKTRKQKNEFFRKCTRCNTEEFYFVNL